MQIHPENVSPAPPQQDEHPTPGKRTIPERDKHLTVVQVEQHHVCQMESDHIVTVQPIVQPTVVPTVSETADKPRAFLSSAASHSPSPSIPFLGTSTEVPEFIS